MSEKKREEMRRHERSWHELRRADKNLRRAELRWYELRRPDMRRAVVS